MTKSAGKTYITMYFLLLLFFRLILVESIMQESKSDSYITLCLPEKVV